eukprot:scaffold3307_cov97-Skeletonema_menzelii.AAC.2
MELSDWRKVLPMDSKIRVDDSVASLVMAWVRSVDVEQIRLTNVTAGCCERNMVPPRPVYLVMQIDVFEEVCTLPHR